MARHGRIASCAEGRDGCINCRIDPLVEIVACEAVTSQAIDRVGRNSCRKYCNTTLIELAPHLEQHLSRRVVDVIDTSNVQNETVYGFCRSGDETKNLFDEKAGICVEQIRFKPVDNDARRGKLVWRCGYGTPARFTILYEDAGPWTVGVTNLIDQR